MPLPSIVTVVLRLFSLNWFLQGLIMASSAFRYGDRQQLHSFAAFTGVPAPLITLVAAVGLFYWSGTIARIVTPKPGPEINLGGLAQYDLYCFAFTFLGLYFVLSSVADTFNWLHYTFLLIRDPHATDAQRTDTLYGLATPLITLLFGGASMLFAGRCARRLAEIQRKNQAP